MRIVILLLGAIAWLAPLTPAGATSPAARRLALVIGNQDYRYAPKLTTADNDAHGFADALRERGFEVLEGYDLPRLEMNRLFNRFETKLSSGTVAVLYYAGHGVQVGGSNFLVPVDMQAQSERDVQDEGVSLSDLMLRMAAANNPREDGLNLLIVDACRDNPFQAQGRSLGATRGLSTTGSGGVMVLYSAGTNQEALDRVSTSDVDGHGLFTRVLLRDMQAPGVPIRELISHVRAEVAAEAYRAGHEQVPAIYDESMGDFTFTPQVTAPAPPSPPQVAMAPPARPAPPPSESADREALFWQSIMSSNNPDDFRAYIQTYPNGVFVPLARNRIAALSHPAAPPPAPPPPAPPAAQPDPRAMPTPTSPDAVVDAWDDLGRIRARRLLHVMRLYDGRLGDAPADADLRASYRSYLDAVAKADIGTPGGRARSDLPATAKRVFALLDTPQLSPQGINPATTAGANAKYARGWEADNPRRGTARDPREAAFWYAAAASEGDTSGLTQLARLLALGQLGEVDPDGAALLWWLAAMRGDSSAMFNLGTMHERGIGTEVDLRIAKTWYEMASRDGNEAATRALRRLAR